jgi:purine-binding chemotaxis protein CheW
MAGGVEERRRELLQRLRELEGELVDAQAALAALGPDEKLPGLYLVVESAGQSAALPASMVSEIVRLVELTPLPDAPAQILGSFVYRGEPTVAVDLGTLLGARGAPSLDSHVVVLATAQRVGLVVDRVRTLVEAPAIADASEDDGTLGRWGSRLISGLCRTEEGLLPLLKLDALLEARS